ncbi:MAG: DUF402 domain-containing protein [Halobacteriales archaeon]
MPRVRLRGIYATALTERLRESVAIVAPSAVIADRFEADFDSGPPDVELEDAPAKRGVGLTGDPAPVETVARSLGQLSRDTFEWTDPAPLGATFEATVTETLGSGAVIDLGPRAGFLPYGETDRHVTEGDELSVQVREPAPPWADRRPAVGTGLEAGAGPVTLVRGDDGPEAAVADEERAAELLRSVELLSTELPDGWCIRFEPAAADAAVQQLDAGVERAAERVMRVLEARNGGEPPLETRWVWFGREARFTLDETRRAVTTTMPGHHRIKAGDSGAGSAVDLVEALWSAMGSTDPGEVPFPFEVVADQFGPRVDDQLALSHGKPDGRRFQLGVGEVTERDGDTVTLRREMTGGGRYDGLGVERAAGDVATTRLTEGKWWYPTVYRDAEGSVKGTYVNVCTPLELFPDAATYVDLEVDIVKHADGTVERLDDDELEEAVAAGHVSEALAEKARTVATSIEQGLAEEAEAS